MARKPGIHVAKIYAFKSQALDRYLHVRAWEYNPGDYQIRYHNITKHPISVAKTIATAKKLHGMLPAYLNETAMKCHGHVSDARNRLDQAIASSNRNRAHHDVLEYYEKDLKHQEDRLAEIMVLMNSPIDIMLVETKTETTETIA
jgi:hypothetical protein